MLALCHDLKAVDYTQSLSQA